MIIRALFALLCLFVLSSCNTSSAGRLLMMPVNLGKGLLNTAGRTLGRVVEADSQAPDAEALPKPHTRLPVQRKTEVITQSAAPMVMRVDETPST
jgi:hypothetical protein